MSYEGGYPGGYSVLESPDAVENPGTTTGTGWEGGWTAGYGESSPAGYGGGYGNGGYNGGGYEGETGTGYGGGKDTYGGYGGGSGPTFVDQSRLTDSLRADWVLAGGVQLTDPIRLTDALTSTRIVATIPVGIPARMRLRLVAYTPGGDRRGDVPFGLAVSRYSQMGEVPTADAEYSMLQRNVPYLDGPVEVAVQYSDVNGQWQEPINGRYLIDKDDYDRMDNGQLVHKYSFLGYVSSLKYADVGAVSLNADGKRAFNSVTPGSIMLTLINQAKAAGFLPFVNVGFTANRTSDGQPWAKVCTRDYSPEIDLLSVLQNFFEAGLADFWMDGRDLQMSNPDTVLGRDLTLGNTPVYVRDQTLTSSPESVAYGDMITKVRVVGDNGLVFLRDNPLASRAFGERVKTLSLGGVSDQGTGIIYADQLLKTGEDAARSLSREYTVTETTKFAPERNYRTGDWIKADTDALRGEKMRAFATSVREEGGELKAFVTLGTVHDDLLLRLAKRQNGIVGGSGVNSGGTPAPPVSAGAIPKSPAGLVVDVEVYNDNAGYAQAAINATWAPVAQSTTNGPVDITGYELWYRLNTSQAPWRMLAATDDAQATFSPLPTRTAFSFKVRAQAGTKWSAFSPEVVLTTPGDVTPPPLPTLPTTTSTLGVITVAWDGKSQSPSSALPFDFDHVDVYQQQGAVAILIDSLQTKGFTSIGGLTAGQSYSFALRAVDKSGNSSPLTAWVAQLVVSQIYTTQITDDGITAPKIATNAVTADAIMAGSIDGMIITAPIIRTAPTGQRSQFDTQGLRLWDSAGVLKIWASPASGKMIMYNTGDASRTSNGHALQFGADNGRNVIIDNNEIIARDNGQYASLLINREGGPITMGGIEGDWLPDGSNYGEGVNTPSHTITMRGNVRIANTARGDYSDENPPLLIGDLGGAHLFLDRNEVSAADGGDFVGVLHLQSPRVKPTPGGYQHHNQPVVLGSDSLAIRRNGDYEGGDRGSLIYSWDGGPDVSLQFADSGGLVVKKRDNTGFRPITASSFNVSSQAAVKEQVADFEPLAMVKQARSKRWQYRPDIETEDVWHFGPMLEDLPPEVRRTVGRFAEGDSTEGEGYDVGSMVGILWEAMRLLINRAETLAARVKALEDESP